MGAGYWIKEYCQLGTRVEWVRVVLAVRMGCIALGFCLPWRMHTFQPRPSGALQCLNEGWMPCRHAAMCCVVPFFVLCGFLVHSAEETNETRHGRHKEKIREEGPRAPCIVWIYYPWASNCHRLTGENRRHEKKWRTKEKENDRERERRNERRKHGLCRMPN